MSQNFYKKERKLGPLVKFLNIISEENRLKILFLLSKGEKCVCEIWQELKLPQNLVSHHLKVLKDFGLVSMREEGVKNFYKLNKKIIQEYLKLLNDIFKSKEGKDDN